MLLIRPGVQHVPPTHQGQKGNLPCLQQAQAGEQLLLDQKGFLAMRGAALRPRQMEHPCTTGQGELTREVKNSQPLLCILPPLLLPRPREGEGPSRVTEPLFSLPSGLS